MAIESSKSPNYRKPPVEHQFKKGQSGNPKGRPKKKRELVGAGTSGGIIDRVAAMALEEATRPILVREGGRIESLPAIQAVIRSMFRVAAQGDSKTQRHLLDIVGRAEVDRATAAQEAASYLLEHQAKGEELIAEHERQGVEPPEIYPHPDDIMFDFQTGEITIDGPVTKEQAAAEQLATEHVVLGVKRYLEIEVELKNDPKNTRLRKELVKHMKYLQFLQRQGERNIRREAKRLLREAMNPRPSTRKPSLLRPDEGSDPKGDSER
jgi:uncharacterized protein DUF5681